MGVPTSGRRKAYGLVAVLALASCAAHFSGAVTVDGQPFVPVACRSGASYGGFGVQMTDAIGRRLRLGANVDGSAGAALFQPGAAVGDSLGSCGQTTMMSQHSRVHGIQNMEGTVTLSCEANGHQVTGQMWFENCH
jgi:hypothetical protein